MAALVWSPQASPGDRVLLVGRAAPRVLASAVLLFSLGVSTGHLVCGFRRQFSK